MNKSSRDNNRQGAPYILYISSNRVSINKSVGIHLVCYPYYSYLFVYFLTLRSLLTFTTYFDSAIIEIAIWPWAWHGSTAMIRCYACGSEHVHIRTKWLPAMSLATECTENILSQYSKLQYNNHNTNVHDIKDLIYIQFRMKKQGNLELALCSKKQRRITLFLHTSFGQLQSLSYTFLYSIDRNLLQITTVKVRMLQS